MFSVKKTVFSLVILFFLNSFNADCQVTLYEENFNDISIDDYGYYNGMSLSGPNTTKWSLNQNGITWYSTGYFVVKNKRFESYKTGAVNGKRIIWTSSPIDISAYTATVSIVLGTAFKNSNSGIEAFYSTNNGSTWTSFGSILGNQACPGGDYCINPYSKANITGTSLIIKVEHWGTNSTPVYYHDDVKVTGVINCTAPTTPATATGLTLSNATKNSLTVNWNSGNGTNVLVTAMDNATAEVAPASSTVYTANTVFGDATKTTGTGNYVVYSGANTTSTTVTGLQPTTTYKFYVYPYNLSPGTCFLTSTPYTFTATTLDVCNSPLAQASYINFPSKTKTDVTVNWTNGSGDRVLVVARKAGDAIVKPTFGTAYTANAVFGSGQTTGAGNFVVYDGTGTTVNVTGLTESTSYTFDIYTYYVADHCYKGNTTIDVNQKTVTTKSDFYNIKDLTGTSITTCEGKVVDGGGVSGTYASAGKQTLTISAESSTDGSCLNFTQWELDNSSEVTFYDGATKIYTAKNSWNQTNNEAPAFKGPGLVCASPGNPLKIEFDPNGTGAGFTAEISCYTPPKPCEINVSSVRASICKGESVELIADGFVGASLLNNDFNTKTLGTDWSTLINPRFDNPCNAGFDATYFWTSTDKKPRDLTSKGLDVSQGGSVSFDFRLAAQGGENETPGGNKDCEGSEKIEEGVFIEYSIDGTTWKPMHYFFPSFATNGAYVYFNEATSWQRYYFEIPKAAQTKNTKFRWIQYEIDDDVNDVWGLDRINITAISPFKIIWKDITNNLTVGTSGLNEAPYKVNVSPTATTIYEAQIVDATTGKLLCSKQLTITVSDFTVTSKPETVCGQSDGEITFSGTGVGVNYSINNGISYSSTPTFTGLKGGTYDVVYQSPTCTATKKITITSASGGPNVDGNLDIDQCVGTSSGAISFKSTPADAAVTYNWSNDNTTIGLAQTGSGNITPFTLTNTGTTPLVANLEVVPVKNGCTGDPKKIKITVKPKDDANFIITDYCEGSKGTISITGVTGGTFSSNVAGPIANVGNTELSGGVAGNYVITYTTSNCTNTSTQALKINAPIDATFDYDDFCETSPTISAGGATNILKTGGVFSTNSILSNGEVIDATNGAITKANGGTSYTIIYTPPAGSCYNTTQKNIKVKALEQITLTMPDICFGSLGTVTTVTPTGGTFNFVNPPADPSKTSINGSTGVITGAVMSESYSISYASLGTPTECANTKFVSVKTINLPAITIQPANTTDCEGKAVKFVVTATNALSYTWQEKKSGAPGFTDVVYAGVYKAGISADTLHITDNTGLENSEYRVIVGEAASNSACPVTSTSGKIIFKAKTAAPTINCDNTKITTAQVAAEWNSYISTATSFDVKYEYTDPNTSNLVTLTANQLVGKKDFTLGSLAKNVDVKITVTPLGPDCYEIGTQTCKTLNCQQPTINTFTGDVSICENATNTTFAVTATANNASNTLTYAWLSKPTGGNYSAIVNGGVYDLSDPTKLVITPDATTTFKSLKDVTFKVSITENGCVKDTVGQLKVDVLNVGGTLPTDFTVCKGSNSGLLTLTGNTGAVTKWQSSVAPFSTFSDITPLSTLTTYTSGNINVPTKFQVVVKSGLCPEAISSVLLIDTISSIGGTVTSDVSICYDETAGPFSLTNNIGNVTKWQYATTSNPTWTDIVNTTTNLTSGKLTETTTFRAEVQNNSCPVSYSTIVRATVNPLPVVTPTFTSPCEGEDLLLNGNTIAGATYAWSGPSVFTSTDQNPTISKATPAKNDGKYTLTITDGNGCKNNAEVQISIHPNPIILTSPLVVCEKSTLKIIGNHPNAATNAWTVNNTNSNIDATSGMVTGINAGTSDITFTDVDGCKVTKTLTIQGLPNIDFTSDKSICIMDSLYLTPQTTPANCSLVWHFGDGTSSTHSAHKYQQGAIYSVGLEATTLEGCKDSIVRLNYIEVIGKPKVLFTFSPDSINIFSPEINFTNLSDAKHYKWVFGDGLPVSMQTNPTHVFPDTPGQKYTVTLTGYNTENGCDTSYSQIIPSKEALIYYIPNTFTPNGDEVNNTFKPVFFSGLDIFHYRLVIYNRWGELIFESNNAEYGWDGTYGNKMTATGTYVWKLEFDEKLNGISHTETGHVNIVK